MIVEITRAAERDLIEIGTWIARDDPNRAATFVRELRQACAALTDFPRSSPPISRLGPNARKRTHGHYLILYDVLTDRVRVNAIVHGARDLDALF